MNSDPEVWRLLALFAVVGVCVFGAWVKDKHRRQAMTLRDHGYTLAAVLREALDAFGCVIGMHSWILHVSGRERHCACCHRVEVRRSGGGWGVWRR